MIDFTDLTQLDPAKWYYDPVAGEEPIKFIEKYLDHFEAQHEGKRFILQEFQKAILRAYYGVKSVTTRLDRYRTLYWESGKGVGKTPLAAALGLYHLLYRKEASPLVQSMASTFTQAEQLFDRAKTHIDRHKQLRRLCTVQQYRILCRSRNGKWKVQSGAKKGKSGSAPSCLIIDELHEMEAKDGPQLGVLLGNLAKRQNSKCIIITNAGVDLHTPCGQWHERALGLLRGERFEDDLLPVVMAAGEDDDISLESTWRKACPSIGVTLTLDDYRQAYQRTVGNKGEELSFRRLWLTQWTRSDKQLLDPADLAKCLVAEIPDEVKALPRWDGLDVGPVDDITAIASVWADLENDLLWVDVANFIPRPAADAFEKSNGVPYFEWSQREDDEQGNYAGGPYITLLDLKTLTPAAKKEIAAAHHAAHPPPETFCYDRYQASDIVVQLEEGGWLVESIESTVKGIGVAMTEFQRRVKDHSIRFVRNKCTMWQLTNLGCTVDAKGNALPMRVGGKYNNPRKIDACMAILYAMARACLYMMEGQEEKEMKAEDWTALMGNFLGKTKAETPK
jgi:phage terminase large subunit-like protein